MDGQPSWQDAASPCPDYQPNEPFRRALAQKALLDLQQRRERKGR